MPRSEGLWRQRSVPVPGRLRPKAVTVRGRLLAKPDFWRLWLVGLIVFGVRWLETLAVAVFAFERTGSAFIVALLTMLRMLPMALFGAVVGAVAERLERRRALVLVVVVMGLNSLTLGLLAATGALRIWHLAIASLVSGIGWTSDNPVRRTMIGEVVGAENMSAAMSVDVGANNASQIVGPALGGTLLAAFGIAGVFTVSVLCYLVALAAALRVHHRNSILAPTSEGVVTRMAAGLMLARRDPRLRATLVVTVIFNVFGSPFVSMVPVIGAGSLRLGAAGVGLLASMSGIGSFLGALAIALLVRPPFFTRLFLGAVVLYLLLIPFFGLSPLPVLAGGVLLMTGLANSGFSIMQATLVFLAAPPELRSCLFGVLSVCIGVGMLGFLHIGGLAAAIGAPWATVATGIEGLLALWLTRRWWHPLTGRP
jgi:MFS family permease